MRRMLAMMLALVVLLPALAIAHGGKTDGSGGHWNRKTGEYHYHCGGHPAHSHPDGICPYKYPAKTSRPSITKKPAQPIPKSSTSTAVRQTTHGSGNILAYFRSPFIAIGLLFCCGLIWKFTRFVGRTTSAREVTAIPKRLSTQPNDSVAVTRVQPALLPVRTEVSRTIVISEKMKNKLEHEEKVKELHAKAENRRKLIEPYYNKSIRELCLMPLDTEIGKDGLPCTLGAPGNGDWGSQYTVYITQSGKCYHRKSCSYARQAQPVHYLRRNSHGYKNACSLCVPKETDMSWYREYCEIVQYCDKHNIRLKEGRPMLIYDQDGWRVYRKGKLARTPDELKPWQNPPASRS